MSIFNETQEKRAMLGNGAIYTDYGSTDGKFRFLVPTVEVPFAESETSEVEIKVACSTTVTKIQGVETVNTAEAPVYLHRDCIRILEELDGKTINIISVTGDYTGFKCSASVSYSASNATMDDAWQGTVRLTPKTKPEYIDNCYPLLKATNFFTNDIPSVVELGTSTGTFDVTLEAKYSESTFTAVAEDSTVATASVTGSKLTITGKKAGSTIITVNTVKTGYESWSTTILVIVPETV